MHGYSWNNLLGTRVGLAAGAAASWSAMASSGANAAWADRPICADYSPAQAV
jgi:hypothetical protein